MTFGAGKVDADWLANGRFSAALHIPAHALSRTAVSQRRAKLARLAAARSGALFVTVAARHRGIGRGLDGLLALANGDEKAVGTMACRGQAQHIAGARRLAADRRAPHGGDRQS